MPTTERPSLPELQRWMRWVLTYPAGAGEVVRRPRGKAPLPRHWSRGAEPKRCLPVIGQSPEVSQGERLAIYGDGYFIRIIGVLATHYVCVRNVIGEHEFDHHLMRGYLVKHPSTHKCIDNVGDHFPDYLARRPEAKKFPFLVDLARLEWAYHEAFYADERPPLDRGRLAAVALDQWNGARVTLDPSVKLLDLKFSVVPLWRADGQWTGAKLKRIRREASPVLVYRRSDGQVRVAEETPAAFELLRAFQAGRPFGPALRASIRRGLTPQRVMKLFDEWAGLGVIRRVDFR